MPDYSVLMPIEASAEVVFEIMSDHARYVDWTAARRVSIDVEGVPAPNGLGAVRIFHTGLVKTVERVVVYEPPHRLVYVLDKGLPIRGYRAEMVLRPTDSGVELDWSGSFEPIVPGTGALLQRLVRHAIVRFAEGIRDAAEAAET